MYRISCIAATYQNCRENNEDNYCINSIYADMRHKDEKISKNFTDINKNIFAVFDGLGGEEKGEEASFIAAKMLSNFERFKDIENYYKTASNKIHKQIYQKTSKTSGTTAAILEIYNSGFVCSNVGDSRVYIIRNNTINQLSKDHTTMQAMMDSGIITKEKAEKSIYKNMLSQYLGISEKETIICPYVCAEEKLHNKDIFLLCSDGLTSKLNDEKIKEIILNNGIKFDTIDVLYKKAVKNGTNDNITIILIYISKNNNFFSKLREVIKGWMI